MRINKGDNAAGQLSTAALFCHLIMPKFSDNEKEIIRQKLLMEGERLFIALTGRGCNEIPKRFKE